MTGSFLYWRLSSAHHYKPKFLFSLLRIMWEIVVSVSVCVHARVLNLGHSLVNLIKTAPKISLGSRAKGHLKSFWLAGHHHQLTPPKSDS